MSISLYHYTLCPLSRQVRVILNELNYKFTLLEEKYWLKSENLMQFNNFNEVPVLVFDEENTLTNVYSIIEYLIHQNSSSFLFDKNIINLSKIRTAFHWFNMHVYTKVIKPILNEKIIKLSLKKYPDTQILSSARHVLNYHLQLLTSFLTKQDYIIFDRITVADLVAASHLSALDYFGEINWRNYREVKYWYCVIKSRPSFQQILQDKIPQISPSKHYTELDF